MGAGIAGACSRVHNPAPGHDPEGGQHKHRDPPRSPVTAFAGLMALALLGAIASSDFADATVVDLGTLTQCDAQQTLCPDDSWEPRDQMGIVAKNGQLSERPSFRGTAFLGGATNRPMCWARPSAPRLSIPRGAFCGPSPFAS